LGERLMARQLKIEIAENLEYLEKSLRYAKTASQKERLQMLWWLKSGQVTQHQELAKRLGRNPSTVTRWLQQYRSGGLAALLRVKKATGQPAKIDGELLSRLQERLAQPEGFKSYKAVQQWLEREGGRPFKYKTVHQTVYKRLGAKLKVPRPCHAQQDQASIDRFKKTLVRPS
jgi:transposase